MVPLRTLPRPAFAVYSRALGRGGLQDRYSVYTSSRSFFLKDLQTFQDCQRGCLSRVGSPCISRSAVNPGQLCRYQPYIQAVMYMIESVNLHVSLSATIRCFFFFKGSKFTCSIFKKLGLILRPRDSFCSNSTNSGAMQSFVKIKGIDKNPKGG